MNAIFYVISLPWLLAREILAPDPDSGLRMLLALPFIGLGYIFIAIFTVIASAVILGMIMFPFWAVGYLELL